MFDVVDAMLRRLLGTGIPGFSEAQVGFIQPDKDWRSQLSNGSDLLNVYLVDIRENLKLRSNERSREIVGGVFEETIAPTRLDCHFLLSAWSASAAGSPLLEPAIDEHVLLYQATRVLMDNSPLDARAIYAGVGLPALFPDALLEPCAPTAVAPPDGFQKIPDFWTRMDWFWKPVVELVVTLPVVAVARVAGPPVTTLMSEYLERSAAATLDERVAIGGVVRAGGQPVAGAWVRIVEIPGMATTNAAGQFVFEVGRGLWTLEAGAAGHAAVGRSIEVPSLSGEYDVSL